MNSTVKRYAFRLSQLSEVMGGRLEVVEYSGDGLPYVLAADYDALEAECEMLRAGKQLLIGDLERRDATVEALAADLADAKSAREALEAECERLRNTTGAREPYPHDHPLHKAVFMARESYTGDETFEDGVRGLIADLKDARKASDAIREFEKSGWHGSRGYHAGLLKAAQIVDELTTGGANHG